MLTGDLVRPRLYSEDGELHVKMLDVGNRHWHQTALALIALFQRHLNQTQGEWVAALEAYEGDRTDYTVLRGLAKVLCDSAKFSPISTPLSPVELRAHIFAQGPVFMAQDLLQPKPRAEFLQDAAALVGLDAAQAEEFLYADRATLHRLVDIGPEWTPDSLIARYNLELSRAALYWSDGMTVEIYDTFKDFWKYLKLFKLMFWATPKEQGYEVALDGPISPFVKSTTRYGRQLAAFLPALFLCERWQMTATVRPPHWGEQLTYYLDHEVPLSTHFKGSGEFDSRMEADFAADFQAKFGDERGKWLLTREDEVLLLGDTVMIPDFAFTHKQDGRRALLEIVGYWHPNYLKRKIEKVRAAKRDNLILLVYEGTNLSPDKLVDVPAEVLYFKKKPVLKDVMAAIERIAV